MKKTMSLIDVESTASKGKEKKVAAAKPKRHWLGYLVLLFAGLISLFIITINIFSTYSSASVEVEESAFEKLAENSSESIVGREPAMVVTEEVELAPTASAPDTGNAEWHYYNSDLQEDGVTTNDYNFGPNPVLGDPEALESLKKAMERKGVKDTITMEELAGEVDPKEIDKDFRERMRKDPALGSADMAWSDSILGTRYLGTFYSEAKEKWDVAMNDAKEHFISDRDDYYKTLDAFEKYLDSADKVEIRKQTSGLTDQMYMNPFTKDSVPDIIVMESADHAGWFLVYHFTIKETAQKEIQFRLDCGYQPTNVMKIMKVKAKRNPEKKKKKKDPDPIPTPTPTPTGGGGYTAATGGGSSSGGGGGGSHHGGGTPDRPDIQNPDDPDPIIVPPDPTPVPGGGQPVDPDPLAPVDPMATPAKDPTNGTQVLPNDVPGPGQNTNNPADPNYSTADQSTNSNHMLPDQYDQAMKDNHDANENSRQGGDSNTPSTPAPSPDNNVDNNADKGTGNGGIDSPTPTSDSSVANDPPGGAWDGPSDGSSNSSGKKKHSGGSNHPDPD